MFIPLALLGKLAVGTLATIGAGTVLAGGTTSEVKNSNTTKAFAENVNEKELIYEYKKYYIVKEILGNKIIEENHLRYYIVTMINTYATAIFNRENAHEGFLAVYNLDPAIKVDKNDKLYKKTAFAVADILKNKAKDLKLKTTLQDEKYRYGLIIKFLEDELKRL